MASLEAATAEAHRRLSALASQEPEVRLQDAVAELATLLMGIGRLGELDVTDAEPAVMFVSVDG